MTTQQLFGWLSVLAVLSLGCGASSSTSSGGDSVSGTVTVNGEPLPYGVAEFHSQDSKLTVRRAVITAGKFAMPDANKLPPGDYSVRICPYEPEVEELKEIPEEALRQIRASRNLIPLVYQQPHALDAKVASGTDNSFKFDLRTK